MIIKTLSGVTPGQSARFAIRDNWQAFAVDQLRADSALTFWFIACKNLLPEHLARSRLRAGVGCVGRWQSGRTGFGRVCGPLPLLDRASMGDALRRLGGRLPRRGVVADLCEFGGAAIALAYDSASTNAAQLGHPAWRLRQFLAACRPILR
jgi:hypothetical protein